MSDDTLRPILEGESPDLAAATRLTVASDDKVVEFEDGQYLLESDSFDGKTVQEIAELAGEIVTVINGAATVRDGSYRPIRHSGVYRNPNGDANIVVATAHFEIRATAFVDGVLNGQVEPPTEPDVLRIGWKNDDVAKVYMWIAQRPANWFTLWNVYDLVREQTSGKANDRSKIVSNHWATAGQLDAFERSANDPTVSGHAARHQKRPRENDQRGTIDLEQGRTLMIEIVRRWVDSLA